MGDWDDLVIICGTTFWSGTRLLDQHIAKHLTAYAPVLFLEPPTSVLSRFRNPESRKASQRGIKQVSPRLAVMSPRVLPLQGAAAGKAGPGPAPRRDVR